MPPNILLTGASGYLGGTLFHHLSHLPSPLPAHGKIYALVRTDEQAERVKSLYNAEPLTLDLSNTESITTTLLTHEISIVFWLIDAGSAEKQLRIIDALGEVGSKLGVQTHFLHTTGAKLFSNFAGLPTEGDLGDSEEGLYELLKEARGWFEGFNVAREANVQIIDAAEAQGVRSYIFIPCIVYGKGTGFGNKISIQTVAIVRAAKALRRVHRCDDFNGVWPVSHIHDTTTLYTRLLRCILSNHTTPYGKRGFYLASSGTVAWNDIYAAMAQALFKRGVVDSATVGDVSARTLEEQGRAIGCPAGIVVAQMGGRCTLQAENGRSIGWSPEFGAGHILETAGEEVDVILEGLGLEEGV